MAKTFKTLYSEAQRAHTEAAQAMDLERVHNEVLPLYNNLLNQAPKEPSLIFSVATCHLQLGNNGLAINLLEICINYADDQPEFWNNLGSAYKNEHNDDKARECFEKALALRDCGEYHSNLATLYINQGAPEKGLEHSSKSLDMDDKNPKNHWNHALLLLEAGHFEPGFIEYDAGLISQDRPNRMYWGTPMFQSGNLEELDGKTVVVYGEQGLGDEIMFATAIPDLIKAVGPDGHVIYDCHDRLEHVMRRSFPQCTIYPTRKGPNDPSWVQDDNWSLDYRIAIGSLFRWFGAAQRPAYMIPDLELVNHYREVFAEHGPGPYVGIGYEGGAKKTHGHLRSFKLTPLRPILEQQATFVSLQYTPESTQKWRNWKRDTDIDVLHLPDALFSHDEDGNRANGWDYDHTIAMIAALDLVIVPNTTVVHVCGALGQTCWTLTPDACAWRYCNCGNSMCWYENHVFQFFEDGDWDRSIKAVAESLSDEFIGDKAS